MATRGNALQAAATGPFLFQPASDGFYLAEDRWLRPKFCRVARNHFFP